MIRSALLTLAALLLPCAAHAQSNPGFVDNQRVLASAWNSIFAGKADATNGVLNSPTISGGTFSGTLTGPIGAHHLLANASGSAAAPGDTSLSALIDAAVGNTQGDLLYRGATAWSVLAPGTAGQVLQSGGATANPSWTTGGTGNTTKVALPAGQLRFGPAQTLAYYDPEPSGLTDFLDQFATTGTFAQIGTGTFSVASNVGTLSATGTGSNLAETESGSSYAASQMFVEVTVTGSSSSAGSYSDPSVGIFKDASDFVAASVNALNNGYCITVEIGGTSHYSCPTASGTTTYPFRLGMSLIGNSASVWLNKSLSSENGWVFMATLAVGGYADFTTAATLSSYKAGVGVQGGSGTATYTFANFRSGRFGGVHMFDQQPVLNQDGTIYTGAGGDTVYFTADVGDPAGAHYMGVFTLNLDTQAIAETGVIAMSRGGHVYFDTAGQIVTNGSDRKIIAGTWATGTPVSEEYADVSSGPDPLTTNLTVISPTALSLPLDGLYMTYDGSMLYDSAHGVWRMAYTVQDSGATVNEPAQATSPDLATWTLVGVDASTGLRWEGTRMAAIDGALVELASGPFTQPASSMTAADSCRIYDTSMAFLGLMHEAVAEGADNAFPPHCTFFPSPNGYEEAFFTFNNANFPGAPTGINGAQPLLAFAPLYAVH